MGLVFLIVAGGVFGWLATIIAPTPNLKDTPANMLAGIGGALLSGLVVCPMLGKESLMGGHYSISAVLISMIGAVVALFVLAALRGRLPN